MITAIVLSPAVDKIYFVEDFNAGNLYRVRNVVKSAGGKGINVARVASLLGNQVNAIGFKAGGTGEWLESELKSLGVHTDFIRVEGESRTNSNIIDKINGKETELLEIGPFITGENAESFFERFLNTLKRTSVLVCSGGLPEGIPADFYRKLIDAAKPFGIKTILDSSNEMLTEGIMARPFMVKPNLRELGNYAGKTIGTMDEVIEACRTINSQGVELVVTSLGKDGAVLVSDSDILYAVNPQVDVINTIGSGDSMVAGFASAFSKGCSLEEALRLGTACAVANTQFSEIGFINRELVDKYSNEIVIKRIK